MYEMEQIDERVILVGIDTGNEDAANRSLDELSELAKNGTDAPCSNCRFGECRRLFLCADKRRKGTAGGRLPYDGR